MKAYDFTSGGILNLNSFRVIKSKELVYLRYSSAENIFQRDNQLIVSLGKKTSQLVVSIPADEALAPSFFENISSLGVSGVALRFRYNSQKWLSQLGLGSNHSGDRDVIETFQNLLRIKPRHIELVAELEYEDDSRLLGPTIVGLHTIGCPWLVVNVPETPNEHTVRKMAEVFEYLKIRNVPMLNVYLPFWLKTMEEWNIKTQNTFSGLSEIHIDLSNKCTHSCVFCGLYAPDSITDMKNRHEGKLPSAIVDHMSKEINFEKCLEFIETLPWTVRQIQFGGLGDPLMHEHAVDLIKAARERGIYVEMLSNMDYLNEEEIKILHDLGGSEFHDLHFIANVSGGDVETYIATRPKQTIKNFENVKKTISTLSEMRNLNGDIGVNFTIMCVVNKHNCSSLENIASYAKEVGAKNVWFKPMEVHGDYHRRVIPTQDQLLDMALSLEAAMNICVANKIVIFEKEYCETIVKKYKELADVK